MPTSTKEQGKKDKEAVAAKGLTPGTAAINKGQTSIISYTAQGVLGKSTPLTPKDKTLSIKKIASNRHNSIRTTLRPRGGDERAESKKQQLKQRRSGDGPHGQPTGGT
jgi:hypothetical protein